jgi:tRNA (adenine37-N6)-methyltransferase
MEISLKQIAKVSNSRLEPIDDEWDKILSQIILDEQIPIEAISNIQDFSHLEIIFLFDKVEEEKIVFSGKPRGNPNYPEVGIFAQRKKDRPNRIGTTIVELIEVKGRTLTVKKLDAINGTPILDIKPIFKEFLPNSEVKQPLWVSDLMQNYF